MVVCFHGYWFLEFSMQCGSCWAFSVVGAVQSVHAIGSSQLVELSVQQVLDCSFETHGCDGGTPTNALKWLTQVCRHLTFNCQQVELTRSGNNSRIMLDTLPTQFCLFVLFILFFYRISLPLTCFSNKKIIVGDPVAVLGFVESQCKL